MIELDRVVCSRLHVIHLILLIQAILLISSSSSILSNSHHSSVNLSNKCILKIITNNPIVTMISSAKPNQPSTIALVPTPLLTDPFPKSCATCAAATEAVCCHSTLTNTNIEAMKINARATCDTGREGKGLISMSEPVRASCSSCQPGNVARRRKVMKARTIAMMLRRSLVINQVCSEEKVYSQQIWKHHTVLECVRHPDQIQRILID